MAPAKKRVSRRAFIGSSAAATAASVVTPTKALGGLLKGRTAVPALPFVRVSVASRAQARLLDGFDLACGHPHAGSLDLILWPGDAAKLARLGLKYDVLEADLLAVDRVANLKAPALPVENGVPGERTNYRVYADFLTDINALAAAHPDRARVVRMPEKTREGRDVFGLEICTDPARNDGRPTFYMDGVHHSREWPAAEMPMMFAFDLLESYNTDAQVKSVVDSVRTFIFPIMNPDGYITSRDAPTDQDPAARLAYWRKNKRSFSGVTIPMIQKNPDYYGVDPNRNYGFNWGGDGSSATQTGETYRGDAPFSEPETRNVRQWVRAYSTIALISNHTHGNLMLRPWGFVVEEEPLDVDLLANIGEEMKIFNGYKNQTSLQLYVTTGTSPDWAYGAFGTIGYVFEHGNAFHPAYANNRYIPAMYERNRGAFLRLAGAAADPSTHGVITGRAVDAAGAPIAGATVRVHKDMQLPQWNLGSGANPANLQSIPETLDVSMTAGPDGTFTFHVNPSTSPLPASFGETENYAFSVEGPGGKAERSIYIRRNEVIGLGDVTVA